MEIKNDNDAKQAALRIQHLQKLLLSYENEQTSKILSLRVSITGILWRIHDKKSGFTIAQIRKHYSLPIKEFCENFEIVKKCIDTGDIKEVKSFFEMYC